jgi:hypothetical protein
MNIVGSLKSIPVTKAYWNIITVWDKEAVEAIERRPFRVYLPCGAEGFAIGDVDKLAELMDAQCEGHWVEQPELRSPDGDVAYWEGSCIIGVYTLGVRIEAIHQYINDRESRRALHRSARGFVQSL